MADRDTLLALATRCEDATGPDRALDGEIWRVVNGWAEADGARLGADDAWHRRDPEDSVAYEAPPPYTASLDAALTLVGEGGRWSVEETDWHGIAAYVRTPKGGEAGVSLTSTPILALCASALRARAAEAG